MYLVDSRGKTSRDTPENQNQTNLNRLIGLRYYGDLLPTDLLTTTESKGTTEFVSMIRYPLCQA